MKVAYVSECFLPTRNGVVTSLLTFNRHLTELGHDVCIFAPGHTNNGNDRVVDEPKDKPKVHTFPSFPHLAYPDYPIAFPYSRRAVRTFNEFAPDVVHAHSFFWLTRLGAWLAYRRRTPLVCTFHTLVGEFAHYVPLPRGSARRLVEVLTGQFCNWCDLVIVPTESVIPVLRGYGVKSRVEILPTGIEIDEFTAGNGVDVRRKFTVPLDAELLLYVGRIATEKNIGFLLEAVSRVLASRPRAYLLLVGAGPQMSQIRAKASGLQGADRIVFAGSHDKDEMKHFYAAADLFVFASVTETQGLVLVEAMASELPCVALDVEAIQNVVGENGVLVPPVEQAFARAVNDLLDDDSRRRLLGSSARQFANQNYSARSVTNRLVELYDDVRERRRRGELPPKHPNIPILG